MTEGNRPATPAARETPLSLDLVFELLADSRRRFALYHLADLEDGVTTIPSMVDDVVEREHDTDPESVAASLQHVHLPRLNEAGVIDYDVRSESIRYWERASLDEWLEHARHVERHS